MSTHRSFKMVAYTDAAGKYNAEAYKCGNEDSFYVDDDLSDDMISHCRPDIETVMSECGILMVVADGMGGMNAGEVASEIAIDTVKEFFAPGKITPEMASSHSNRSHYMEKCIKTADKNIKNDARQNPAHYGMGSTIIMAWMAKDELSISWCGDSRAYIYTPASGLNLISTDHSYVQELVNKGLLTYEQTFDHPQGNIITRSLGDPSNDAKPESRLHYVTKGDIILLCSDGLSGVIRDRKTYDEHGKLLPGDNIEDIITAHQTSMRECREALWLAAEKADWYDNVTAILCQVTDGNVDVISKTAVPFLKRTKSLIVITSVVIAFILGLGIWAKHINRCPLDEIVTDSSIVDKTKEKDTLNNDNCGNVNIDLENEHKGDSTKKNTNNQDSLTIVYKSI